MIFNIKLIDFSWTFEYVYLAKAITRDLIARCQANVSSAYAVH